MFRTAGAEVEGVPCLKSTQVQGGPSTGDLGGMRAPM